MKKYIKPIKYTKSKLVNRKTFIAGVISIQRFLIFTKYSLIWHNVEHFDEDILL